MGEGALKMTELGIQVAARRHHQPYVLWGRATNSPAPRRGATLQEEEAHGHFLK